MRQTLIENYVHIYIHITDMFEGFSHMLNNNLLSVTFFRKQYSNVYLIMQRWLMLSNRFQLIKLNSMHLKIKVESNINF